MPVLVRLIAALVSAILFSAPAATLAGRVVEQHSGNALPSAGVRVYKLGIRGLAADLETDREGRFHAEGLAEGEYRIEISKPNFLPATIRTQLPADPVVVRLIRYGAVSGRVTDAQGQPVPGVTVFALRKAAAGPLRQELILGRFARVDTQGRYRLFNLPPGEYVIAASYGASTFAVGSTGSPATSASLGSGYLLYPTNAQPQAFRIVSGEEFPGIDFAIFPSQSYSVSGKVDGAPTKPEQGRYWIALTPVDQPAMSVAVAQAGADGAFRFNGIGAGSYHLFVSGPSRARGGRGAILERDPVFARTRVDIGAQDVENLAVSPDKGRPAVFVLQAGEGCSSSAEIVLTTFEDWSADLTRRERISAGAEHTMSNLAPTRYSISISGGGENCYGPADAVIDLTQATPAGPVAVPVSPGGAIRGRLDTRGAAPSSFTVVLVPEQAEAGAPVQAVVPDAESRFAFAGLRPGRYRVLVEPGERTGGADVEVAAGAVVELTLAASMKP